MRTGFTLSPDSRPLSGDKLSNMPSNLLFSSGCEEKTRVAINVQSTEIHKSLYDCFVPSVKYFIVETT